VVDGGVVERVAVDRPAFQEELDVGGDVRPRQQFRQVGLQVEQPVPAATGQVGIHAGPDLAGRHDVHHREGVDLVGGVQGVPVGHPAPAVVSDQGDSVEAEVGDQGPQVGGHAALV
jgi:hypothetical protein